MSTLTEIRKTIVQEIHTTVVPAYVPKEVPEASFEEVKKLEDNAKWNDAADKLYTITRRLEVGSEDRGNALIGLGQQMINLGSYHFAEKCLQTVEDEFKDNQEPFGILLMSQVNAKRGWLADIYGRQDDQHAYLSRSLELVRSIDLKQNPDLEEDVDTLLEGVTHFFGREYEARAMKSRNRRERAEHIRTAIDYFMESSSMNLKMEARGKFKKANIGFGKEHMAICLTALGQMNYARQFIESAGSDFQEFADLNTESNIMGHYHTVKGIIDAAIAQNEFEQAIEIYREKPYALGAARAHAGAAGASLAQWKVVDFFAHGVEAMKEAPQILAQAV